MVDTVGKGVEQLGPESSGIHRVVLGGVTDGAHDGPGVVDGTGKTVVITVTECRGFINDQDRVAGE